MRRIEEAALQYHRRGWHVVALRPKSKAPYHEGWPENRYDEVGIEFAFGGEQNVGVALGSTSDGLIDSDLDCPEAVALAPHFLPSTTAVFGRPSTVGAHRLYYVDRPIRNEEFKNPVTGNVLLDLRGDGHQTMFPPSIHPEGEELRWETLDEIPTVKMDDLLAAHQKLAAAVLLAQQWPQRGRHDVTLHLAGALLRARWDLDEVVAFISRIAEVAGDDEIPDRIRAIRDTAAKMERDENVTGWPSLTEALGEPVVRLVRTWLGIPGQVIHACTDLGNAERLIERHGQDIRYVPAWEKWIIWDGKRWAIDTSLEIERRAIETAESIYQEVATAPTAELRKKLARWALRSSDSGKITAMLKLAKPKCTVSANELDTNPFLLNLLNGTYDLRTASIHDHRREDLITKLAYANYDPQAKAPVWESFLARIMDNRQDMINFLQRAVGYSATGSTSEDKFFVPWGNGRNGKSTFIETLEGVLGDYAESTSADTFTGRHAIPNALAKLAGARFVSAAETDKEVRFSESLIKRITGGDKVQARYMRAEWFEFEPSFKLWIATNHKPNIDADSDAMWERVMLLPFTVYIPSEERDPNLRERLAEEERDGIMLWIIQGAEWWLDQGLAPIPEEVSSAVQQYRKDMDSINDFFENRCVINDEESVTVSTLYRVYQSWSRNVGVDPLDLRDFRDRMEKEGFQKARRRDGMHWLGIGIAQHQDLVVEEQPFGNPFMVG